MSTLSLNPEATGQATSVEEQPRYSKRDTLLTMIGVLLVMLLASLDQTIVSTAMPRIIGEFNGLDRYTWVTTAYLLTSTVMIPIYGKLSDLFGRKIIFLIGVMLFLIGSAASGMAQDMNQLIAFRAFQGLGAAALMPIAMAVIGDLFTPRERGRWQGLTGAVFGLSSVLGPALGGFLTDNWSWRWVFYVNLPIGLVAMFVLIFLMPSLRNHTRKARIDYLGALLLAVAVVPLLLGFTWAGNQYDWNSPQVLGLFAGSLVFFVLFFVYEAYLERHKLEPIVDPSLFKSSIFDVSIAITMITSAAMFGSIFFLPLFAQGVLGISATNSGFLLSPMMITLIIGSVISGQLVARFGKYKWIAILGATVSVAGALLFLRLNVDSSENDLWLAMLVLGIGIGFGMSIYTVIIQNAMPTRIGQATSAMTFFRQIAATIALAAMGSLMTSAYVPAFHNALTSQTKTFLATIKHMTGKDLLSAFDNPNILLSADARAQLAQGFGHLPGGTQIYNQLISAVKMGLTQGIHDVFIVSVCLAIVGFLLAWFLKEIPLRGSKRESTAEEVAEEVEEGLSATVGSAVRLPQEEMVNGRSDGLGLEEGLFATDKQPRVSVQSSYSPPLRSNGKYASAPVRPAPTLEPVASTFQETPMWVSSPERPEGQHQRQLASAISQVLALAREANMSLYEVHTEIDRQNFAEVERKLHLSAAVSQLLTVAHQYHLSLDEIHDEIDRQETLHLQAVQKRHS